MHDIKFCTLYGSVCQLYDGAQQYYCVYLATAHLYDCQMMITYKFADTSLEFQVISKN